jgi:protein-S-isoprenylcysteine O-methyltransferase Ste14
MKMPSASPELKRRVAALIVAVPVMLGLIFFVPAGTLRYWQAWAFMAVLIVPMMSVALYFLKHDPELLDRRLRTREKERPQKIIQALSFPAFLAAFLLPGLDHRFAWSSVPPALSVAADLVVLAGYSLFVLVIRENSYASRIIEVDEHQRVISTGPYAVVRHPMYVAIILIYFAGPLALGSFWALISAAVIPGIMVARILNEERVLREKLAGYEEYMSRVRYRLIPGIW